MANHIIHKQKIVVKTNYEALTQTVADEVSQACKNELPDLLQTVFDELASDDEIIRIDSLHVDLGTLSREVIKQSFAQKTKEKIREAIVEKKEKRNAETGVVILSKEQSLQELLFYFLQTGSLPWFTVSLSRESFETQMQQALEKQDWQKAIDWISRNERQKPAIIKRLVYQFSDDFLERILFHSTGIEPNEWKAIYKNLTGAILNKSNQTKGEIRNKIWLNALPIFLHQKQKGKATDELINNFSLVDSTEINKRNDTSKIDAKPKGNVDDAVREAQYVSNCGIVLLHPFLLSFFAELNLLKEKQFVSIEACQRAVLLLHYLATGETTLEEWNVVLVKVLCGLALDGTLPNTIDLSNKEMEESEALLQVVIRYWPPLRNTSVAGLQQSFLQREGKLEQKQNGWLLTVEQKTIDILLDKLPWGFSTVTLPWMKEIISVDWC